MPFIGNQPALSYTSFAKQDFTTSATTSYTLDHPVANQNELALFINFVRQEPTTAYTASGTSLTLTSATSASDDMYCVFLGKAVQTINPPNGSVGTAQIADLAVTSGKLASGVLPTNTPAFFVSASSSQSISNSTFTQLTIDSETYDTDNAFASNKFTVPSGKGGFYAFNWNVRLNAVSDGASFITELRKNGTTALTTRNRDALGAATDFFHNGAATLSLAVGDYIELWIYTTGGSTTTNENYVYLSGYKLIGV
ncbi:c1q globular head like domain containing protein [uncultured Mediterranean phage uvMED]|nr:c1q globular head like domain containing protein [uncultured Mediterranean phage uvMED]